MSAIQGPPAATPIWLDAALLVALRLIVAAVLGGVVALLYRSSRAPDARTPGFAHTLLLLAPLIAMVTIAVGDNVAAAFTLVGTLAIVRFRTAVRDSRDMAFVIFSVATGMALGADNRVVAATGVVVVGVIVLGLRRLERARPGREAAILRLSIAPPDADPQVYAATLAKFAVAHSVRRSAVDRKAGVLDLRLAISGLDPDRSPRLLAELLLIPDIIAASFAPEEPE